MDFTLRIVNASTMKSLQNADDVVGRPLYAAVWPLPDPEKKYEIIVREIIS
jgi:hypothetical protein